MAKLIKGDVNTFGKEFHDFKERLALKCVSFAATHFIITTSSMLLSMMMTVSY